MLKKSYLGSTIALVFGVLLIFSGIMPQDNAKVVFETSYAGICFIIGALAYRSAKKRNSKEIPDTDFRKASEVIGLIVVSAGVLLQNDSLRNMYLSPVTNVTIPIYIFTAYFWVDFKNREKMNEGQWPKLSWIIACLSICAVITAFSLRNPAGETNIFIFFIQSVVYAAVIATILHLLFIRRESIATALIGSIVILITIMSSQIYAKKQVAENMRLKQTFRTFVEQGVIVDGSTGGDQKTGQAQNLTDDEKFVHVILEQAKQLKQANNEYQQSIEAAGVAKFLDGNRLRHDKGFIQTNEIINKANSALNILTLRRTEIFQGFRKQLEVLDISEPKKIKALAGFDKDINQSHFNRDLNLEKGILVQFENILSLFQKKQNAIVFDGSKIQFNEQSDLDLYNSYLRSIQNLSAEQEKIQAQAAARTKNMLGTGTDK